MRGSYRRICTVGAGAGDDRHGLARVALAAGAALSLAVVGGLSLAAADAEATTFPGTNGRIAASGALNTGPYLSTPTDGITPDTVGDVGPLSSKLEIFTMGNAHDYDTNTGSPDFCQLIDNELSDYNPRYSKDGKKVAFVREGNIWTMQLNATGRSPDPGSTDGGTPAPDSGPNPCATPGQPYQDPIPGSQLPLTESGTDTYLGGWCTSNTPTLDPTDDPATKEEWVVFQRGAGVATDVWKQQVHPATRAPVGPPVPLTGPNTSNDSQPSVRPDCSKIAFHSNRPAPSPPTQTPSSTSNIWVMSFDGEVVGGAATPVTHLLRRGTTDQGSEESAPSWSPSTTLGGTGTKYRIAFQGDKDTSGTARNLEIYRIDEDGANLTRLTNSAAPTGAGSLDLTGFDLVPSYSPDGSKICFHSGRAAEFRDSGAPGTGIIGQWEIYTADASGANVNVQRKTKRPGNDERCGWQATP